MTGITGDGVEGTSDGVGGRRRRVRVGVRALLRRGKSGYFRAHSLSAAAIRVAIQTVFPVDEWTTRTSHSVGERH
jgi:hypothetical protein